MRLQNPTLYYDALNSAAYLGKALGKPYDIYVLRAKMLSRNIEKYFGANVEGYETYRYYDGNDKLRSWICIPLTVGIFDRRDGHGGCHSGIGAVAGTRYLHKSGIQDVRHCRPVGDA